jgi:hypothetical protein
LSSVSGSRIPTAVLGAPIPLRRLAPVIAFFLSFFVYNIGFRYVGSGDTVPAELLPISLLHGHGFDFREFVSGDLPYWFRLVQGRVVSNYPVLTGLLNLPVYAFARLAGVDLYAHRFFLSMLTASFVAALSVFFLERALARVCRTEKEALFFAVVYAFGTTIWSVASRALFQHGASVLFLSIALWALLREGRTIPLAGLALGLAVVNRPTNIAIALPLAIYVLRYARRWLLGFAALALLPALFHFWYAATYWGSPLSLAQDVSGAHFAGSLGRGLAGILISPSRGLFVFSPVFLFAIPAAFAAFRPAPPGVKRLPRYLVVAVLLTLLVYSRWTMWWGGHTFGYRLVTELAPLLTILVAGYWPRIVQNKPRLVLFGLCFAFSVYANFIGAMVFPSGFNNNLDLQPSRLWDLRNSELELSTRKLIRLALPNSRLAAAFHPARGIAPPPTAWWRPELDDDSIPGWIDGPLDGSSVRGPLEISGWARSGEGDVDVRVAIAPDGIVPAVERRPRPDVQHSLPQLGDCSRAGWRAVVERPAGGPTEHVISIELKAPNGRVRRLGPIRLRWVP